MSLKNPVTPPGIDPGTVRLVAQRLNHYATPGPLFDIVRTLNPTNRNLTQSRLSPPVFSKIHNYEEINSKL
jgi:hypothetical protein